MEGGKKVSPYLVLGALNWSLGGIQGFNSFQIFSTRGFLVTLLIWEFLGAPLGGGNHPR